MFGIALGIHTSDFKGIFKLPRSIAVGITSQFVLLPLFTVLLIWAMKPNPGIALGMILVAACPGGNVSNFISTIGGGNVILSVSLTAFATLLCPVLTPVNFQLYASILPETASMLKKFELSFIDMLRTVFVVLLVPTVLGMWMRTKRPNWAKTLQKPVRMVSFAVLLAFILLALINNLETFRHHLLAVFVIVMLHNAIAFSLGYASATLSKLPFPDRRSICIETGIQNSGLGLIIIFTFFGGNGEMALVAAWWGVWHIVAGLVLAGVFRRAMRSATVPEV